MSCNTPSDNPNSDFNTVNVPTSGPKTYILVAYFRKLLKSPHSNEIINYLLGKSGESEKDWEVRWNSLDLTFGEEHGKIISALSFSACIEARGYLLDSLLETYSQNETVILELPSGFSSRALCMKGKGFPLSQYIESDLPNVTELKCGFYNHFNYNSPHLLPFRVGNDNMKSTFLSLIKKLKQTKPAINKLVVLVEGLLIYLTPEEQKDFFEDLKKFAIELEKSGITLEYISTDIPTHENFTKWLVHEGFTSEQHIAVMNKIDPSIVPSLHETEAIFFEHIGWPGGKITRQHYSEDIIKRLKTPQLYEDISGITEKISDFLKQEILFAYTFNPSEAE